MVVHHLHAYHGGSAWVASLGHLGSALTLRVPSLRLAGVRGGISSFFHHGSSGKICSLAGLFSGKDTRRQGGDTEMR